MNRKVIVQQVFLILLFVAIVVTLFIGLWPEKEVHQEPGVMAKGAPKVTRIRREPIHGDGYEFLPVGSFSFTGRVLQKRKYYYILGLNMFSFDKAAAVSPVDYLIGWNEMSDETTLKIFRFYIDGREWSWKPDDINDRPKLKPMVEKNIAMMHVIPGGPAVEHTMGNVFVGSIIKCKGEVVKVSSTQTAYSWGTSKVEESRESKDYIVWLDDLRVLK